MQNLTNNPRLDEESFFARPLARLISLVVAVLCAYTVHTLWQAQAAPEDMLKAGLLTGPASLYLLYRSFIARL